MNKSAYVNAFVEPQVKAGVLALARITETNVSAIIRLATRRYIESEMAMLERRIAAGVLTGHPDAIAVEQLAELRAAYEGR